LFHCDKNSKEDECVGLEPFVEGHGKEVRGLKKSFVAPALSGF
jgi:hypothetical protein